MKIKCGLALLASLVLVSGCSQKISSSRAVAESASAPAPVAQENKLGTAWGEDVYSKVTTVDAKRMHSSPDSVAKVFYSAAASSNGQYTNEIVLSSVRMRVQTENNRDFALNRYKNGEFSFSANDGERYQLFFYNTSPNKTYEVVTAVDGLDVISGRSGSLRNSGYLVSPKGTLVIEGFRKSDSSVAAFRFAKPDDSYAASSLAGEKENTGVIGVAVYEMALPGLPDCQPQAFPGDAKYAPAPCKKP
ncbi:MULTISPECIES: hypothetical protein [Serratia]|jgi:hypothetical protein|uniref:Lipoprotein n=1 Tax=Serratia fonticola TaxID=47917 RepID=A0AAE7EET1_SERFO|nr:MULTISPECIES: hypothetical protein [Serratia]ATM76401.1 hypothetical protein CRN79_11440 [Serratia fonticola]MBC3218541.1 hypothetical protein [Serratia fonticola]MBC3229524.1 hypothetical protein [Serratia fonticola]MCO7510982.1 hypothetical protein [Serratia fonticola]NCG52865.1 hypothetical protein [Serratia fonticola]